MVGDVKRIANFASVVVPVMTIVYILGAIVVGFVNADQFFDVLSLIFSSAFGLNATFGAIVGTAVEWGVKRGIYSNEAGRAQARTQLQLPRSSILHRRVCSDNGGLHRYTLCLHCNSIFDSFNRHVPRLSGRQ